MITGHYCLKPDTQTQQKLKKPDLGYNFYTIHELVVPIYTDCFPRLRDCKAGLAEFLTESLKCTLLTFTHTKLTFGSWQVSPSVQNLPLYIYNHLVNIPKYNLSTHQWNTYVSTNSSGIKRFSDNVSLPTVTFTLLSTRKYTKHTGMFAITIFWAAHRVAEHFLNGKASFFLSEDFFLKQQ